MPGTLMVRAFGQLTPYRFPAGQGAEEDLSSVFLARSELMGWSRLGSSDSPPVPLLWGMNQAELTNDGPEIGFAQVTLDINQGTLEPSDHVILNELPLGVDPSDVDWAPVPYPIDAGPPTDPQLAIPPLIQCVDDSLRWLGEADVSAYQVTATHIAPVQRSHQMDLYTMTDWFSVRSPEPVRAVVTLAIDQERAQAASDVIAAIQQIHAGPIEFRSTVDAPAEHAAGDNWEPPKWENADAAVTVKMPGWSADSIGWVIAMVFDAALTLKSAPQHLSVRVTRTAPE